MQANALRFARKEIGSTVKMETGREQKKKTRKLTKKMLMAKKQMTIQWTSSGCRTNNSTCDVWVRQR